jgi:hypothetical protein
MTRKDYVLIAEHLAGDWPDLTEVQGSGARRGFEQAIQRVADAFGRDNPRFDRARFLAAAGVPA